MYKFSESLLGWYIDIFFNFIYYILFNLIYYLYTYSDELHYMRIVISPNRNYLSEFWNFKIIFTFFSQIKYIFGPYRFVRVPWTIISSLIYQSCTFMIDLFCCFIRNNNFDSQYSDLRCNNWKKTVGICLIFKQVLKFYE